MCAHLLGLVAQSRRHRAAHQPATAAKAAAPAAKAAWAASAAGARREAGELHLQVHVARHDVQLQADLQRQDGARAVQPD
jgi:hypothetical protein